jgi:peptidoglycan hydrolase-like protein with peptidoglycan-binding domain
MVMPRPARRREPEPGPLAEFARAALAACGGVISRNPLIVGGSTAFLVAFFFVSANAVWYQPHGHTSAFFVTRPAGGPAPAAKPAKSGQKVRTVAPQPSDPVVAAVQKRLAALDYYTGAVDGVPGPQTRQAIENYQASTGLAISGRIDDALLDQLALRRGKPRPQARAVDTQPDGGVSTEKTGDIGAPESLVVKIQAGLKAFGHEEIEIDGVVGLQTSSAIREFQALFGLPKTGKADQELLAKMQEIGLTN